MEGALEIDRLPDLGALLRAAAVYAAVEQDRVPA
jgi:hypothetical protein